jgi:hypothetical protein
MISVWRLRFEAGRAASGVRLCQHQVVRIGELPVRVVLLVAQAGVFVEEVVLFDGQLR